MNFKGKYQQIKIIKSGDYVILFKVSEINNAKEYFALKMIKKELYNEYKKEIEVMKNIKSKYVIKLKDNFYDEKNEGYCIVMELCDGDLRMILNKYKPNGLPMLMINKIFLQLNDAFKAMIDLNYTHRNLKPENILIKYLNENKNNFDIKLTDFGLSTNEINSTINYHSLPRTKSYIAPEIEDFKYNNKCDLWSLGVILYELYTNKYIFYSDNPIEGLFNRYDGKITRETDNEMINRLLRKLIQVDINKRINWEEYFNDDFFKIHNKIDTNPNEQIINIKFKVNYNNEEIKLFNGNEDINKNNIKIIIDNKEFKEEINNLKKGNYNAIIKINQKITNCLEMFYGCKNILEINFRQFDTKNVSNMNRMFSGCSSLTTLNVSKFDTKYVTRMSYMFSNCSSLTTLDVSKFDTKNVTEMSYMFYNCSSLTTLDVSKFDTKNVNSMDFMFYNCSSLTTLDVSKFDTKNVTNMNYMFSNCSSLTTLDISKFDTKNVEHMDDIFKNCKFSYDKTKFK